MALKNARIAAFAKIMLIYRGPHAVPSHPRAVTVGNFDGVHRGHQAMLTALVDTARKASLPAAVMTFEPYPRELFTPDTAPARLASLREKCEMFKQLGVDEVIVCRFNKSLSSMAPEDFVGQILSTQLQAKHILIGDDFRFGRARGGNWALIEQLAPTFNYQAAAMHSIEWLGERVSSTAIREALQQGDLHKAGLLLGRPYSMSGAIIHGDKIGRTIGFPTANIRLQHNRPPLLGIYAVEVSGLGDKARQGAASIGFRPTVGQQMKATLEVHLLDFDEDVYGCHVHVDFLHKLRNEAKYPDLDSLKTQIQQDINDTRAYFAQQPESCVP